MFNTNKYVLHNNLYLDQESVSFQLEAQKQEEADRRKRRRVPKPPENQMSFDDLLSENN